MSTSKVAATAAASISGALVLSEAQTGPFENGMAILMNTWPALSMAVENEFGGPESADKRDWMCGEVANLFKGMSKPVMNGLLRPARIQANKQIWTT